MILFDELKVKKIGKRVYITRVPESFGFPIVPAVHGNSEDDGIGTH